MKIFFAILSFSILLISCNNSGTETIIEKEAYLIPKKYEGFYAGMSTKEFEAELKAQNYNILEKVNKWIDDGSDNPEGPLYIANNSSGDIVLTGYIIEDKMSRIVFEGKDNFKFVNDLKEINNNFSPESNLVKESYSINDFKTMVNSKTGELILLNWKLNDKRMDAKLQFTKKINEIKEKKRLEILQKYQ